MLEINQTSASSPAPVTSEMPEHEFDTHRRLFASMVEMRATEESLLELFSRGLLRGTVHTCIGQEATAAGVVGCLDPSRDVVCSNHRGHGHYLAFCGDVRGLIAEIMGLSEGICGGVGGSQHLHTTNFYTNGILGGMVPVATGMALAEKLRGGGGVVVVFLGDGAFGEGVVYESMNMASLWSLPIIFAVEQNYYAQSTPCELEHAGRLQDRPRGFGLPVIELDGNDVMEVHGAAQRAVEQTRTQGPRVLFMHTYRLAAHSKGDDLRDPDEIAEKNLQEPLRRSRAALDSEWCDQCEAETRARVDSIVKELVGLKEGASK